MREFGEAATEDRDAGVLREIAHRHRNRFGVLVHDQQAASRAKSLQHAARVTATPERAIQVRPIPAHVQAVEHLRVHHGKVAGQRAALHATHRHS